MFRFRRRVLEYLHAIEGQVIDTRLRIDKVRRELGIVMSNQEVFDAYAAKIAEQNNQIKAAVAVIIGEIASLKATAQSASEQPLDTSAMDAALEQLTAAVDEVEAIPAPAVEESTEEPAPPVE